MKKTKMNTATTEEKPQPFWPFVLAVIIGSLLVSIGYRAITDESEIKLCRFDGRIVLGDDKVSMTALTPAGNKIKLWYCKAHAPKCDWVQLHYFGEDEYWSNPKPYQSDRNGSVTPPAVTNYVVETNKIMVIMEQFREK